MTDVFEPPLRWSSFDGRNNYSFNLLTDEELTRSSSMRFKIGIELWTLLRRKTCLKSKVYNSFEGLRL